MINNGHREATEAIPLYNVLARLWADISAGEKRYLSNDVVAEVEAALIEFKRD